MEPTWLVLLCQSCERAFGKPRSAKNLQCPHCNHSEAKILSRHLNANEASAAVSVANVPLEIRDQLSTWLNKQNEPRSMASSGPVDGQNILTLAADESGIVTLKSLQIALRKVNSNIDAEAFAEHACAEGELLRDGPNRWKCA